MQALQNDAVGRIENASSRQVLPNSTYATVETGADTTNIIKLQATQSRKEEIKQPEQAKTEKKQSRQKENWKKNRRKRSYGTNL